MSHSPLARLLVGLQLAARLHACLIVRLALTSSGTNQYRRVVATSGGKDALITAVERPLLLQCTQQQLHSDASFGICRGPGGRYGTARADDRKNQLPLLWRSVSE